MNSSGLVLWKTSGARGSRSRRLGVPPPLSATPGHSPRLCTASLDGSRGKEEGTLHPLSRSAFPAWPRSVGLQPLTPVWSEPETNDSLGRPMQGSGTEMVYRIQLWTHGQVVVIHQDRLAPYQPHTPCVLERENEEVVTPPHSPGSLDNTAVSSPEGQGQNGTPPQSRGSHCRRLPSRGQDGTPQ